MQYTVTLDSGWKPNQNLCLAERHAKLRVKEFACLLVHCERVNRYNFFDCVYRAKGGSLLLARVTMIPPRYWEQNIFSFLPCISRQLLNLRCGGCEAKTGWVWTS